MKAFPQFLPYPLNPRPAYLRWLTTGAVMLCLVAVTGMQVSSFVEPRLALSAGVLVMMGWLLALILRMLYHHANRANAKRYAWGNAQVHQCWWQAHRQHVSMIESVMIGAACSPAESVPELFASTHLPGFDARPDKSLLRSTLVYQRTRVAREAELARWLAWQWQEEYPASAAVQPLQCYWLGSPEAWQAFTARVAELMPLARLPQQPQPWQGIETLDGIIDSLQGAAAPARVLCAGCLSLDDVAQAGEAAVLWLLGPQGGPHVLRGEWVGTDADALPAAAQRALKQAGLDKPAQACMSFSQPASLEVGKIGWDIAEHLQDAQFGALGELAPMVTLTLACEYARSQLQPCAWLASDPQHTLALGVVLPDV
ncbi:hypothetical protein [Pseudomonas turukhanskensis]|uniref:Uncharacterized protein n=1 Tax=Pseudomonas turukhanskensis TaxID=1806536 RepID=A0A9W6NFX5_9PSED|nr:hypothetical protein [Pseudomonas turukhanskensis]GLK89277.1 hypothetical protein GCM10017655_23390 [Pseudomonas turukhanskensis]